MMKPDSGYVRNIRAPYVVRHRLNEIIVKPNNSGNVRELSGKYKLYKQSFETKTKLNNILLKINSGNYEDVSIIKNSKEKNMIIKFINNNPIKDIEYNDYDFIDEFDAYYRNANIERIIERNNFANRFRNRNNYSAIMQNNVMNYESPIKGTIAETSKDDVNIDEVREYVEGEEKRQETESPKKFLSRMFHFLIDSFKASDKVDPADIETLSHDHKKIISGDTRKLEKIAEEEKPKFIRRLKAAFEIILSPRTIVNNVNNISHLLADYLKNQFKNNSQSSIKIGGQFNKNIILDKYNDFYCRYNNYYYKIDKTLINDINSIEDNKTRDSNLYKRILIYYSVFVYVNKFPEENNSKFDDNSQTRDDITQINERENDNNEKKAQEEEFRANIQNNNDTSTPSVKNTSVLFGNNTVSESDKQLEAEKNARTQYTGNSEIISSFISPEQMKIILDRIIDKSSEPIDVDNEQFLKNNNEFFTLINSESYRKFHIFSIDNLHGLNFDELLKFEIEGSLGYGSTIIDIGTTIILFNINKISILKYNNIQKEFGLDIDASEDGSFAKQINRHVITPTDAYYADRRTEKDQNDLPSSNEYVDYAQKSNEEQKRLNTRQLELRNKNTELEKEKIALLKRKEDLYKAEKDAEKEIKDAENEKKSKNQETHITQLKERYDLLQEEMRKNNDSISGIENKKKETKDEIKDSPKKTIKEPDNKRFTPSGSSADGSYFVFPPGSSTDNSSFSPTASSSSTSSATSSASSSSTDNSSSSPTASSRPVYSATPSASSSSTDNFPFSLTASSGLTSSATSSASAISPGLSQYFADLEEKRADLEEKRADLRENRTTNVGKEPMRPISSAQQSKVGPDSKRSSGSSYDDIATGFHQSGGSTHQELLTNNNQSQPSIIEYDIKPEGFIRWFGIMMKYVENNPRYNPETTSHLFFDDFLFRDIINVIDTDEEGKPFADDNKVYVNSSCFSKNIITRPSEDYRILNKDSISINHLPPQTTDGEFPNNEQKYKEIKNKYMNFRSNKKEFTEAYKNMIKYYRDYCVGTNVYNIARSGYDYQENDTVIALFIKRMRSLYMDFKIFLLRIQIYEKIQELTGNQRRHDRRPNLAFTGGNANKKQFALSNMNKTHRFRNTRRIRL